MGAGVGIDFYTRVFAISRGDLTFPDNSVSVGIAGRVRLQNVCIGVVEVVERRYGVPDAIIVIGPGFRRQESLDVLGIESLRLGRALPEYLSR